MVKNNNKEWEFLQSETINSKYTSLNKKELLFTAQILLKQISNDMNISDKSLLEAIFVKIKTEYLKRC